MSFTTSRLIAIGGLLGLACSAGWAQPAVTLETEVEVAYVNEPFLVSLRIENFGDVEPFAFPHLPDCTVRQVAGGIDSTFTSIINGRRTVSRSRTYQYELTPRKAGELVIPPITVRVDGQALRTAPLRVLVRPSDAGEIFFAEITCDRERVYVGQRVRLVLTIWVKPTRLGGYRLSAGELLSCVTAINFGPFPTNRVKTGTAFRTLPDGTKAQYYTYESYTDYVPDRPGPLQLDEIEIGIRYPTRLSRDIFGRVDVSAYRNLRARPTVTPVEVLPLPTKGRPPNFTGAVGTFNIAVSAEPTRVRVGDPIQLTIEIRGDGVLESLPPPDLAADPRLTRDFRVPQEDLAGEVVGSRKRFTQIVRALRADVEEIPPIEYPYFDPDREAYVVALSDPIPLDVAPAAELDADALAEQAGLTEAGGNSAQALQPLDGLRGNETREEKLLAVVNPVSWQALAWGTFAPPAVFLLTWFGLRLRQAGGPARQRRQRALRNARRRLEQARRLEPKAAAAEIHATLAGYLADRLDQPTARFLGTASAEFLRRQQAPPDLLERWQSLVERCELASFGAGGDDGDIATLIRLAQDCLKDVERVRL